MDDFVLALALASALLFPSLFSAIGRECWKHSRMKTRDLWTQALVSQIELRLDFSAKLKIGQNLLGRPESTIKNLGRENLPKLKKLRGGLDFAPVIFGGLSEYVEFPSP